MYIWRAYQSPASTADCGPQCAQIPNFASRNQSGIWYFRSDTRVLSKGPLSIGFVSLRMLLLAKAEAGFNCKAGTPKARLFRIFLLEMGMVIFISRKNDIVDYSGRKLPNLLQQKSTTLTT